MPVVIAVAAFVAGCGSGSGSSSAERTRLTNKVAAQLQGENVPADLSACVTQGARALPIADLRKAANAGSNPDPATKQIGLRLLRTCIDQGRGLAGMRSLMFSAAEARLPQSVPPAFKDCLIAKVNALAASQLDQLITPYATSGQAAGTANAYAFGVGLGRQCLTEPAVVTALRGLFMTGVRRGFQSSHFSAAFQKCVIGKAEAVPSSQIEQFALDPAHAHAGGEALGRKWARACIAAGARP